MAIINSEGLPRDIIVIGASAGGFEAIIRLLSRLSGDVPATLAVVLHRGAVSQTDLSPILGAKAALKVVEPKDGESVERGTVYVAPSDRHMRFQGGMIQIDTAEKEHHTRPAVDPLFASAAHEYRSRVVAVVLSGGGHDGVRGLVEVKAAGGLCIVQDPAEAAFPSMPANAIRGDHVDAVLNIDQIGDVLGRLARGETIGID